MKGNLEIRGYEEYTNWCGTWKMLYKNRSKAEKFNCMGIIKGSQALK
jgi:hypothetical protein